MKWAVLRQVGVVIPLALVAIILWIDVTTHVWQDYVILSGLAAGVVTFVLTALIIDRVVARSAHERWAPVTRLAMYDILHALADDELSEITHGKIVPRQFAAVSAVTVVDVHAQVMDIRERVVTERQQFTAVLAVWSNFLASSADAIDVLEHKAEIAERLGMIRDAAVEADPPASADQVSVLNHELDLFNEAVGAFVLEVQERIQATNKLSRFTAVVVAAGGGARGV